MTTWIFQANPDTFDIDRCLADGVQDLLFTVTRYDDHMSPGDQVFLWRAQGRSEGVSGIVAEGRLLEKPRSQPDEPSFLRYWADPSKANTRTKRVRLRINRVAKSKEVIKRSWLEEDPVANDLAILRMSNATNLKLPSEHAERLNNLWVKTGVNWDRSDSLAGLWAYHQTYGQPISRLDGSPVANVALTIGRAVTGVYNKVLNFRYIDPRDSRSGLSGGGRSDAMVWEEFYLSEEERLDTEAVEREFHRIWGEADAKPKFAAADAEETQALSRIDRLSELKREELEAMVAARMKTTPTKTDKPVAKLSSTRVFERDQFIVALRRVTARFICEVPDCSHPVFEDDKGRPYCEVHHIEPLADGGPDTLENLICLCPAHHVQAHRGQDRDDLKALFLSVRESG